MSQRLIVCVLATAALIAPLVGQPWAEPADDVQSAPDAVRQVLRCPLNGTVDAGSAGYLTSCVERAEALGAAAVLVPVDTPGGSLESTRQIVRTFLEARVPIIAWVGPSSARAGSAGVFVTMAAHVATMAPGTNIGAAHPVEGLTGRDPSEAGGKAMGEKVLNDAVAFARAIAEQRRRNVEWAARAVRDSESISSEQAVQLRVVDGLAASETDALRFAEGRVVTLPNGEAKVTIGDAQLVGVSPSLSQRLLHTLANPGVAYVLFLLGMLGIAVELSHPGAIAPGVIGVTAIVLALLAFSALPVSTGAVVLLVLGALLIGAELFVTSGALGTSGALLLVLGGVLLVDDMHPNWLVDPSFRVPMRLVLPTAFLIGGAAMFIAMRAGRARKLPQLGADLGMLMERGTALTPLGPEGGEVFVHGERWRAVSSQYIPAGKQVSVRRVEGLTLRVEEAPT